MKEYIMALDQGTTSSRCILFDHAGKIVTMAQKEFTQIYPQPGWVEQNPREIWSSQMSVAIEAMANIGASSKNIRAIGITNQRETTIVWDKKTGEPVYNAIVWQCRRTAEQIDELKEKGYGPMLQKRTGLVPDAYFSASNAVCVNAGSVLCTLIITASAPSLVAFSGNSGENPNFCLARWIHG